MTGNNVFVPVELFEFIQAVCPEEKLERWQRDYLAKLYAVTIIIPQLCSEWGRPMPS